MTRALTTDVRSGGRILALIFTIGVSAVWPAHAGAAVITLTPPSPVEQGGTAAAEYCNCTGSQRGAYITALGNFSITSLGMELDPELAAVTLEARIYAATGFSRGALLASASTLVGDVGQAFYDVPIAFSFLAGQEYDIEMSWPGTDQALIEMRAFHFDPGLFGDVPYDVAGLIRVRDGEFAGGAGNFWLGHFRVDTTAVPEPSLLGLIGLGGLGLFRRASRRRAKR